MPRYITRRPRSWIDDETGCGESALVPELQVDGPAEVNTGLINSDGSPIYRVQDPIGFGRDGER